MIELNDGRRELYQWDTGRTARVIVECSRVHFSNLQYGTALVVDVIDGNVEIPDELLQRGADLFCWAFVGNADEGYTKAEKSFVVNKRPKPSDYIFTPTAQKTLDEIYERLDEIEKNSVQGEPGFSPVIEVTEIPGGHRVTITDVDGTESFDVMDGKDGTGGAADIRTDETLSYTNGVLSVNTATEPDPDNTLPITAAAVAATVGNIEILLETI